MKPRIVVVGSLNMDLVTTTARLPSPGETVLGDCFQAFPGGKGANQAVAAARLGSQVTMVGVVGTDSHGDQLVEGLQAAGVDVRYVRQSRNSHTGVALITVEQTGQNTIVVAPGANMECSATDVANAWEAIGTPDVVVLQLEIPTQTVVETVKIASKSGAYIILNPAPSRKVPIDTLRCVDCFVPNELEASVLTGVAVRTPADACKAALALKASGPPLVIITLGEKGVVVAHSADALEHIPAFHVDAVDMTAAGDAFVGALAATLAEHEPVELALRQAMAAGALAVTRKGAQPSLPTRSELTEFLANQRTGNLQ